MDPQLVAIYKPQKFNIDRLCKFLIGACEKGEKNDRCAFKPQQQRKLHIIIQLCTVFFSDVKHNDHFIFTVHN